ncbi:TPA: hypothetical protein ACGO1T_000900 [Streptococcus suis]
MQKENLIRVVAYRTSVSDYSHTTKFNPKIQSADVNGSWDFISVDIDEMNCEYIYKDGADTIVIDGVEYPVHISKAKGFNLITSVCE